MLHWREPVKKDRASNHKQNEIGAMPFPPLPVQVHPSQQYRSTNPATLIIGIIAGIGLIALLIFAVPWGLVSQRLTGSFDSLSTQVKQVQLAQLKRPKEAEVPPETSTPATSTVETAPEPATTAPAPTETAPTPAASEPETPIVETSSTPEVPAPATRAPETSPAPEISTPTTPPIEAAQVTPIAEPDPLLLVGRYPVRKYTDIKDTISKGDTLYNFIRVYENRIFPKKYRNWKQLAQYNGIRAPQYALKLGSEFRIPTLTHIVLPKTGYETELKKIQSELAKQPNNPDLLNQRAIIHFKRNELNQARSTLRQGIRSAPKNGSLHNNLGFIYLIIEDNRRAQSELELAITHAEQPAIPHCNLGALYMTTNKLNLAIKAFESALEADANLLDAKYNLALANEKAGNVNVAREQLRELNQLLSDDPDVASALERLTSPQVPNE